MTDAAKGGFTKFLKSKFDGQAAGVESAATKVTKYDCRTVGYATDDTPPKVEWMAMVAVPSPGDQWKVITVQESYNKYLSALDENERLMKVTKVSELKSFEDAVKSLGIWEMSKLMTEGKKPVADQDQDSLDSRYYRYLAMRRGFWVNASGDVCKIDDNYPTAVGSFLKSDFIAQGKYRAALQGDDVLDQLLTGRVQMEINEDDTTLEEDIQSFGEINLLDKMQFFVQLLVEYSRVKLQHIEKFYGNPAKIATGKDTSGDFFALLNGHKFFNDAMIKQFLALRAEFAESMFRIEWVERAEWDKPIDFDSPDMRKKLLVNPEAKEFVDLLRRPITYPLDEEEMNTLLMVSAMLLRHFREMLSIGAQKDRLERQGLYKYSDVNDILNFLDLLEIKYLYTELAKAAVVLPQSQKQAEIEAQKNDFWERVECLKTNLRDNGDFSPTQEAQIDSFIKAKTPIYLLDRIAKMPEKIGQARDYVSGLVLPKPFQLGFDFKFAPGAENRPVARATRRSAPATPAGGTAPK